MSRLSKTNSDSQNTKTSKQQTNSNTATREISNHKTQNSTQNSTRNAETRQYTKQLLGRTRTTNYKHKLSDTFNSVTNINSGLDNYRTAQLDSKPPKIHTRTKNLNSATPRFNSKVQTTKTQQFIHKLGGPKTK